MSKRTLDVDERLYDYLVSVSVRETEVLKTLREKTNRMGQIARMQISPDQGQFMAMLVELTGASRLLEVGVFTGYSSLACAMALPPDGQIIACDVNPEWTKMARQAWEEAGMSNKIELRLAPAEETLNALLAEGKGNYFDMMFIDADKKGYDTYYELGLQLVRPGGVILIDNVLWGGDVADPSVQDPDTEAIRALNAKLFTDERISVSLVPIGDGLTLARKRG
jgi:predicted O-methyltransferase YrrM